MSALKTLVLGGYGNFGARIARALVSEPRIELVVGGRDLVRAELFAASLGSAAQALRVDAASPDLADTLQARGFGLVIHTAGPFQAQGHGVARSCSAAGCHYIDLADGRRFVCDFPAALHESFQRAGRSAITGASTVPALSSAVVEHLSAGWLAIHSVDICIAPAQSAPRGVATLAGVLSYCGAPVSVWQEGHWQPRTGWAQPEPVRFARLKTRLGALCDVPDLEIFPERYRVRDRVMFRAALEVGLSQRAFAWIAAARSRGWFFRPEKLAAMLHGIAPVLNPWGSALGGMVVCVSGLDSQGKAVQRAWHLAADHDHGPEIPAMPAILLARRIAQGHALPVGAHTATGLLPLASFAPEFERWGMVTDEA